MQWRFGVPHLQKFFLKIDLEWNILLNLIKLVMNTACGKNFMS